MVLDYFDSKLEYYFKFVEPVATACLEVGL